MGLRRDVVNVSVTSENEEAEGRRRNGKVRNPLGHEYRLWAH